MTIKEGLNVNVILQYQYVAMDNTDKKKEELHSKSVYRYTQIYFSEVVFISRCFTTTITFVIASKAF